MQHVVKAVQLAFHNLSCITLPPIKQSKVCTCGSFGLKCRRRQYRISITYQLFASGDAYFRIERSLKHQVGRKLIAHGITKSHVAFGHRNGFGITYSKHLYGPRMRRIEESFKGESILEAPAEER